MNDIIVKLALAHGVGSALIIRVLSRLKETSWNSSDLLSASMADISHWLSCTQRQARTIVAALKDDSAYHAHHQLCEQHNIKVCTLIDDDYPLLLSHIYLPPAVLWVRGTLKDLPPLCAVVGARMATGYAVRATRMLVGQMIEAGVGVISGGARGVDAAAHREVLGNGGTTVVVAGSGLVHTYPEEHESLFSQIVSSGGALVSPFPPQTLPSKGTFPARNRVIAGMAQWCLVAQAAARSGALITAQHAVEEGRDVGAIPGPIDDAHFAGSNQLLVSGARVVTTCSDLIEQGGVVQRIQQVQESDDPLLMLLSSPASFDELCRELKLSGRDLQERLSTLQSEGKIQQNLFGQWERI